MSQTRLPIDDLRHAEETAGRFAAFLESVSKVALWDSPLDAEAQQILGEWRAYCRVTCGWLDGVCGQRLCASGAAAGGCGCPCGHVDPEFDQYQRELRYPKNTENLEAFLARIARGDSMFDYGKPSDLADAIRNFQEAEEESGHCDGCGTRFPLDHLRTVDSEGTELCAACREPL